MDDSPCPAGRTPHFFLDDHENEDTALVEYTTEFSAARYAGKAPSRLLNPPRRRPFPIPKRQVTAVADVFAEQEEERPAVNTRLSGALRPSDARALNERPQAAAKPTTSLQTVAEKPSVMNVAPKRPTRRISALVAGLQQDIETKNKKSIEEPMVQEVDLDDILLPGKATKSIKPITTSLTSQRTTRSAIRKSSENATKRPAARLKERTNRNAMVSKPLVNAKPVRPRAQDIALQPTKNAQSARPWGDRDLAGAPTGKENVPPGYVTTRLVQDNVISKKVPARRSNEGRPTKGVPMPKAAPIPFKPVTTKASKAAHYEVETMTQHKIRADKAKFRAQAELQKSQAEQTLPRRSLRSNRSSLESITSTDENRNRNPNQFAKSMSVNAAAKALGIKTRKRTSDDISITTVDELSFSSVSDVSFRSGTSSDNSFSKDYESAKWGLRLKKRAKKSHSIGKEEFPILQDELKPEMYENKWLDAQESSMTMLLNQILETTAPRNMLAGRPLQRNLLKLYSAEPFPMIYKRLQASLLYGALVVPKEILDRNGKLSEDLGMKRRFLDIFVNNYSLLALKASLEVIVGRSCGDEHDIKTSTIERFLEKFLVRADDSEGEWETTTQKDGGVKVWVGEEDMTEKARILRTTLLRCFMLVLLLDTGKQEDVIGGCLFQDTSSLKSSVEVLQALAKLLLPSFGDILRPLAHFNFRISHTQTSLDEYSYNIANLAVDLRDGVRLARLIEVLQSPASDNKLLSSHLKYPAPSRAVRMSNMQTVLEYLADTNLEFGEVTAKDIVDGAREKTLGFLWVLVSRWGLARVVDWNDLQRDVARLQKKFKLFATETRDISTLPYTTQLKAWASTVAALHNLEVVNLTSSFSDGRVFAAIVEEYEVYFPQHQQLQSSPTCSLEDKLRGLGCSKHFASMFSTERKGVLGHVFDENFVVAGLAFLCSRLLNWSVNARAATTIQTAYRNLVTRRTIISRCRMMIVAQHAGAYVNTRARVVSAVLTIQRAFRRSLQRRMDRFFAAIVGVQALSRGVLLRNKIWGRGEWKRWNTIALEKGDEEVEVCDSSSVFDYVDEEEEGDETVREEYMSDAEEEVDGGERTANLTLEDTMTDVWLVFGQGRA